MGSTAHTGLGRWLPANIMDDPRLMYRGRLLLGFSMVLAVAALFVGVQLLTTGNDFRSAAVLFVGGLCALLNAMMLRWHGRLVLASVVVCVLHLIIILLLGILGSGNDDPSQWWLTPAPLLATFLIGPSFGLLSAALSAATLYLMYAMERSGAYSFQPILDNEFWVLVGSTTVLAGIAAVARMHETARRQDVGALQQLVSSLKQKETDLQRASDELRASRDSTVAASTERNDFLDRMTSFTLTQAAALEQTRVQTKMLVRSTATIADTAGRLSSGTQASHQQVDQLAALGQRVATSGRAMTEAMDQSDRAVGNLRQSIVQVDDSVTALQTATTTTMQAMVSMGGSATRVERFAVDMVQSADAVVAAGERGRVAVERTRTGISATREMATQAVASIGLLRNSADEIGQIINVIDEVAAETGVLALNAAIIAAQTGEAGRGFAVVAEQIKAMAQRVSKSTHESAELLQRVRSQAHEAESIITSNAASAVSGAAQSQEAATALEHIVQLAVESRAGAQQIRVQAGEQVGQAGAVGNAMSEVSKLLLGAQRAVAVQRDIGAAFSATQAMLQRMAPALLGESNQQAQSADAIREQVRQVADLATTLQLLQSEQSQATAQALEAIEQLALSQQDAHAAMQSLNA